MPQPDLVILYVDAARVSAAFWADLLGTQPVELQDTFAMLPLREGMMLGLWTRPGVEPKTEVGGGGGEIAFKVATPDEVDATHADWSGRGIAIAQAPTALDFGRTFVALDPDGHRLRVYCPAG